MVKYIKYKGRLGNHANVLQLCHGPCLLLKGKENINYYYIHPLLLLDNKEMDGSTTLQ